jgi:hypothetical protein
MRLTAPVVIRGGNLRRHWAVTLIRQRRSARRLALATAPTVRYTNKPA